MAWHSIIPESMHCARPPAPVRLAPLAPFHLPVATPPAYPTSRWGCIRLVSDLLQANALAVGASTDKLGSISTPMQAGTRGLGREEEFHNLPISRSATPRFLLSEMPVGLRLVYSGADDTARTRARGSRLVGDAVARSRGRAAAWSSLQQAPSGRAPIVQDHATRGKPCTDGPTDSLHWSWPSDWLFSVSWAGNKSLVGQKLLLRASDRHGIVHI